MRIQHLKAEYTLGPTIVSDDYHVQIIQSQLTRNIGIVLPHMVEEMQMAFDESIGEGRTVPLFDTCLKIVAKTASRALVGLPMCRNEEYLEFCVNYAPAVFMSAQVMGLFPRFMMG
jgi:hypothetical protein